MVLIRQQSNYTYLSHRRDYFQDPTPWKFQLSLIHFFKCLVLRNPPPPRNSNPFCKGVGGGGWGWMFSGPAQNYEVGIFADLKCKNSTHWATGIMNNDIINIPVCYHQASKFLHVGLLANPQFFLRAQCRSQFYFIKLGQRVLKTCTFNMLLSKLTKSEALSTAPVSCDNQATCLTTPLWA